VSAVAIPPTREDEKARLVSLLSYGVLDTFAEAQFDALAELASGACGTPIALVSFVDEGREWYKSTLGISETETSRESSFGAFAIAEPSQLLQVRDARSDVRFAQNLLVTGDAGVRFYAALPLISPNGFALGTLSVADRVPRSLDAQQEKALRVAAGAIVSLLEQRRSIELLQYSREVQRLTEARLRIVEASAVDAPEAVLVLETAEREGEPSCITYLNAAFTALTGYEPQDVLGSTTRMLLSASRNLEENTRQVRVAMHRTEPIAATLIITCKNERELSVDVRFSPVSRKETTSHPTHWLVRFTPSTSGPAAHSDLPPEQKLDQKTLAVANEALQWEIDQRHRVEAELAFAAVHDALTRLPNRAMFVRRLRAAVKTSSALDGKKRRCAVLLIDVDRFKAVNDGYGYFVGDQLLVEIAKRLGGAIGSRHFLASFGGDEFAVLIEDIANDSEPQVFADAMLGALSESCRLGVVEIYLTASIGIALSLPDEGLPEEMLRDAHVAMLHAKGSGRARFMLYNRELGARVVEKARLESALRRGLPQGEFRVAYQPIVSLRDPDAPVEGLEALLRWDRPKHDKVNAATFIPMAEESGFMIELGAWALREACRQWSLWKVQFGAEQLPVMSVNVCAQQIGEAQFVEQVETVLQETGIDPRFLALELTESAIMQDPEGARIVVARLRALGAQIHLDDFGTGYSSLSYLRRFAVDRLKIDRSFVSGMGDQLADPEIVDSVISLAHRLGIRTVAEGVETEAQRRALLDLGCDAAQGYLFSAAVEAATATREFFGKRRRPRRLRVASD